MLLLRYKSDNPSSRIEADPCQAVYTSHSGSSVLVITQRIVCLSLNCDIRRYIISFTHTAGGTPRSPHAHGQSPAFRRRGGGGGSRREGREGSLKEQWWLSEKRASGGCSRPPKHAPHQRLFAKGLQLTPHTTSHFPYLIHQSDRHTLLIHQELEEVPSEIPAQRTTGFR